MRILPILNMKKNVLNNRAFTLLEALMSMFVMSFLTITILQWVNVINTTTINFEEQKQVITMTNYIQNDFIGIKDYNIMTNKLMLTNYNNQTISYELKNNKVIRQKNNSGYEILLTNVQSVNFAKEFTYDYITMEVLFNDDEKIKTILSAYYI